MNISWKDIVPQSIILNAKTHSVILLGTWGVKTVAIKLVHSGMENVTRHPFKQIKAHFQREIDILQKASFHRLANVVEVYGTVDGQIPGDWWINNPRINISPLGPNLDAYGVILSGYDMSLHKYLHETRHVDSHVATFAISVGIIHDIVKGLCELHLHGIVHGDLKGGNVLLDTRIPPNVRLCDFGISALRGDVSSLTTTFQTAVAFQGTYAYAAPGNYVD
jgi:serine/threonine protein kinase